LPLGGGGGGGGGARHQIQYDEVDANFLVNLSIFCLRTAEDVTDMMSRNVGKVLYYHYSRRNR
jgi:hypothetical protein